VPDRVLGGVLVGLVAALLALLECFYVNLRIGATPVPLAQVVAALANLALPFVMYRVTGRRGLAVIPGLIWIVIALILAARGPGGDVVVPGNWQGILLLLAGAGAAVISIVVLIQPMGRTSTASPAVSRAGASQTATRPSPRGKPAKGQPGKSAKR